jgi:carbon-monoxide dehydrogenase large subunit
MSILGTRVVRTEDPRLLTRGGVYTDDLRIPELDGGARITFVRSPIAHARIAGIDPEAALACPGVVAVLTAADTGDLPPGGGRPTTEPLLATDRVRYVGEAVAIVVTEQGYQGEDAAELVSVDYEPLPAEVDFDDALAGGTLLFPGTDSNVVGSGGDPAPDHAFGGCEVVVEHTFPNQRVAPIPLEVRASAARWADGRLTFWTSTQNAQMARDALAGALGLEPGAVRVIAPDVGGGFGAKIATERDGMTVAWAAKRLGRPMRWVETRNENLVGMVHGRAQRHAIKIGGTRDGRILAYHLDIIQDCGAYPRFGPFLPTLTKLMAGGVYDLPYCGATYRSVVTTTTPIAAYRGAGRPEATAAIERAVDLFAAEIGMDPAEVRRKNVVPPEAFPYTTSSGAVYDTGDYAAALDAVLSAGGYAELRAEQAGRRAQGGPVQLGLGLACYVEITAGDYDGGETSRVVVDATGAATVYTGSSPHGQGHQTAFAMLVTDQLGIPMDQITVIHGDTDQVPRGVGTYGSRSLQLGGTAVHQAALQVRDQAREVAAGMIEARADDLELDTTRGTWQVRGDPDTALSWAAVAAQAGPGGLSAEVDFRPASPTFPFGAHLAVVEVDTQTGKATLIRHITVDDAGKVLNPVLAEGQRHGGIAQGAAQALLEEVRYDPEGNPLTSTLADYAAITATELPSFELLAMETPTTVNALGVKGIGEAGTIGATPAVHNAVIDAVAHLGVRHIDMPATPQRVWAAINEARGGHMRPAQ